MSKFKVGDRARLVGPHYYANDAKDREYSEAPNGVGSLATVTGTDTARRPLNVRVRWNDSDITSVVATDSLAPVNEPDNVSHPEHYKWLPVEAIEVTEHFNFCMGNALKYIIRADHKGSPVEDLRKALFYVKRELRRRGYEGDL